MQGDRVDLRQVPLPLIGDELAIQALIRRAPSTPSNPVRNNRTSGGTTGIAFVGS